LHTLAILVRGVFFSQKDAKTNTWSIARATEIPITSLYDERLLDKGKGDKADSLILKERRPNDSGNPNHSLNCMLEQEDKGWILMAEYYFHSYNSQTSGGVTTSSTVEHFGDVVAIRFDSTGNVIWQCQQPRPETTSTLYSMMVMNVDNKLRFVYVDEILMRALRKEPTKLLYKIFEVKPEGKIELISNNVCQPRGYFFGQYAAGQIGNYQDLENGTLMALGGRGRKCTFGVLDLR
jgi:hypothetical protein